MSIKRQLPVPPKTGDQQTKAWFAAATEIIKDLAARIDSRGNTAQQVVSVIAGGESAPVDISGKEDIANRRLDLANPDNKTYPTTLAVKSALEVINGNQFYVDDWNATLEAVTDIAPEHGDVYKITGQGSYQGETLKEGDYVQFYVNDDDELDIIVFINGHYKVDKTTSITAGNGLTGGGDLSANRTIALATPGTISSTSANAVTANSHFHALDDTGVVPGTYTKFITDIKGRILFGSNLVAADIPNLDWAKITTGKPTTLAGYGITDAINTSQIGVANGVASLGSDGKVPAAQLPVSSGTTDIFGVGMGFQVGKQINEMWYDTNLNTASILNYQMPAANWGTTFPVFFRENLTISEIGFYVNTGVTGSNAQIGIYSAHPTHGYPYQKLYGSSNITTASAGAKSQTITGKFTFTKNKVYWIKLYTTHTITVTCSNGVYHPVIGASIFGNNINGPRANGFQQIGAMAALTPYFSLDSSGDGNSEVPLSIANASFATLTAVPVIAFRAAAP